MNIRFIRNFTVEPIALWLQRELRPSGIQVECAFGGFAEAADDIERIAEGDGLTVLSLGFEMSSPEFGRTTWPAEAMCERHLMLVRAAVARSSGPLLLNTVLPPLFSATGLAGVAGEPGHALLIDRMNVELRTIAAADPGRIALVDWVAMARELGERGTYDYRYWHASGAPFAAPFLARYAAAIASVVRALSGKGRKCLVLDCDNTLWGGIVGEVGRDGIKLGGEGAGAYFREFQRAVLDLQRRGVAIALCSKNNEADVFEVLDAHPHCLIRREHLAAWRVDWNDKPRSIAAIADELNIGIDAMVFVDDNPVECELVREALPGILVLQTPTSPEELVGFLERRHLFDALTVTSDDLRRTRTYQENRARRELSDALGDLSEYKRRLDTRVGVRRATGADRARVAQLLQRTNQFNLTTRRLSEAEVEALLDDPDALVLVATLEDRFGDLGVIACAIAMREGDHARIDSMLMSCRALGRDAELAFAAAVFRGIATRWDVRGVLAEYIPSPKNGQVADFWTRAGLKARGPADPDGRIGYASISAPKAIADAIAPTHVTLLESSYGRETEEAGR